MIRTNQCRSDFCCSEFERRQHVVAWSNAAVVHVVNMALYNPVMKATMNSDLLPHALNREFPELADAVARLKLSDAHFTNLLHQHDAVDQEITKSETGVAPMGDASLEDLKKQRLHLKDQLYVIAKRG